MTCTMIGTQLIALSYERYTRDFDQRSKTEHVERFDMNCTERYYTNEPRWLRYLIGTQ